METVQEADTGLSAGGRVVEVIVRAESAGVRRTQMLPAAPGTSLPTLATQLPSTPV
jgi:hypothetical protein